MEITANIVTRQVGPLLANGSSEYLYLGCYYDGGGRLLTKQFNNATNENGWCTTTCFNAGYTFAGTEYRKSYPLLAMSLLIIPAQTLNVGLVYYFYVPKWV